MHISEAIPRAREAGLTHLLHVSGEGGGDSWLARRGGASSRRFSCGQVDDDEIVYCHEGTPSLHAFLASHMAAEEPTS